MSPRREQGFTLVEVLIAASVLLTAVLGMAELGNVANRATASTAGHDGATAIARRLTEAARSIPARNLASATLMTSLRTAAPDVIDASAADTAWTVSRRGFTYSITASVCTLDDASDGIGAAGTHNSTYCTNPAATSPADSQPADAQQVTVTVAWGTRSVREVTDVPTGASGALPAASGLTMTSMTATQALFTVTASNSPASMTWLLQGTPMATCPPAVTGCTGSGSSWGFTWNLGSVVRDTNSSSVNYNQCIPGSYTLDGVYEVAARVQDAAGLSGNQSSLSVPLNRCAPLAPANSNATGRNVSTSVVDVDWDGSPEGDIVGYRVYRGASLTAKTPVCPASVASGQYIAIDAATECTDSAPPAYTSKSPYYYAVVAVDRDSTGALREGALSVLDVNSGNRPPNAPTTLTGAAGTSGVTLTWKLPAVLDPDTGDTIDSFRVYRRNGIGSTSPVTSERYDRDALAALCGTGTTCTYVDSATGGTVHTYWVTAVDAHLRESTILGPKSA